MCVCAGVYVCESVRFLSIPLSFSVHMRACVGVSNCVCVTHVFVRVWWKTDEPNKIKTNEQKPIENQTKQHQSEQKKTTENKRKPNKTKENTTTAQNKADRDTTDYSVHTRREFRLLRLNVGLMLSHLLVCSRPVCFYACF